MGEDARRCEGLVMTDTCWQFWERELWDGTPIYDHLVAEYGDPHIGAL
jgi:hypothetical protein